MNPQEIDMNVSRPRSRARRHLLLSLALLGAIDATVANGATPKPVLLVIANQDFHYAEYAAVRASLEAEGLSVVVGAGDRRLATPQGQGVGLGVKPDRLLADVSSADYSAIAFVGGWGASSYQYAFAGTYSNPAHRPRPLVAQQVNRLIGDFSAADKPVAAICHGVTVLAWARVDGVSPLKERVVVGSAGGVPGFLSGGIEYPNAEVPARWQIETNDATMLTAGSIGNPLSATDDVVVDGRIITAEDYRSAARFAEVIAQSIAGIGD